MSELHKAFLRRIKEQETALGLSGLVDEDDIPEPAVMPPTGNSSSTANTEDETILRNYKQFKETNFIQEFYENELGHKFKTYYKPSKKPGSILFCHHGAGSSSMTFGNLVNHIEDESVGIFLFDTRGHGESVATSDFSLDTLVQDVSFVLEQFSSKHQQTSIFLLGHSLGVQFWQNILHYILAIFSRG